jgi:hypothetical protein
MTPTAWYRFLTFLVVALGLVALSGLDLATATQAPGDPPKVVFNPKRPKPEPPGDVRNIESLTTAPAGFTMAKRNNFYKKGDTSKCLYRWASSGHWTNYDEAEVGEYKLPNPLLLADGTPVNDAKTWIKKRRPEIIKLYDDEIYGRVPANAPKVTWEVNNVVKTETTVTKTIVGRIGDGKPGKGPIITITLTLPAKVASRVPVIFGGASKQDVLAKGWCFGTVNYGTVQQDSANLASLQTGVIGMTLKPGEPRPPDEWGVLRAWAWALSRVMDYLETDPDVDATQVSFSGHSRFGKVVLLAAAMDERIAMVFSTCSGEMGASLARRDWGETVDDMAQLFAPHFAGNFQKWVGRWNDMPVDTHMLIALIAPRPVFITGGTQDQWSDPKGEFLAAVAAGPVYRLLGKKDLGATEMPKADMALIQGELAFHEHTGGHIVTPAEQRLFLEFAGRYFQVKKEEPKPGEPKKTKPNPARLKGMKAALADIEAGNLKLKSFPLPDPAWHGHYVELLRKECGVIWETVTDKATDARIAEMGGYNDVMRVEIEFRFERGILEKLTDRAKEEHAKSKDKK